MREILVKNKFGIHARVAVAIVETINKYDCEIQIIKDGKRANASSILEVLMLVVSKGEKISIMGTGKDCDKAVNELVVMFEAGFGEPLE